MTQDISFDNNNNFNYKSRVILGQPETPKMVRFLIGKGIVKSEKSAQGLLITLTILFLLASIYVFATFVFDVRIGGSNDPTLEQKQKIEENKERIKQIRERNQNNTTNN